MILTVALLVTSSKTRITKPRKNIFSLAPVVLLLAYEDT